MAELNPPVCTEADLTQRCAECPVFQQEIVTAVIYAKWESNNSSPETVRPVDVNTTKGWLGRLVELHNEYVVGSRKAAKSD